MFPRNRNSLMKLIGISAATAMALRLIYTELPLFSVTVENNALKKLSPDSSHLTNHKLVSVLLLTRHGARTPLHVLDARFEQAEYKPELLDDFVRAKYELWTLEDKEFTDSISYYDQKNLNNTLKGGASRGMLTKVGEEQMFNLGRKIRQKYVENLKFLSNNYDSNEIYVRSSHYIRTIKSAKSLLSGIYVNSPNDLLERPFKINIEKLNEDILFPNALSCPYFLEMHSFLDKLNLYKNSEYLENLFELNKVLGLVEGESNETKSLNYTFTSFRDDMSAREVHGQPVPKIFEKLYEKSDRFASMELHAANTHNLKISCGQLLNLLKNNIVLSLSNDKNDLHYHKFRYYSAHDSTLNALLAAFDLIDDNNHSWPPFAANIIIELWKNGANANKNEDYFVKIYYCGKLVTIPTCKNSNSSCNVDEFINILEANSVEKHEYDRICQEKFNK